MGLLDDLGLCGTLKGGIEETARLRVHHGLLKTIPDMKAICTPRDGRVAEASASFRRGRVSARRRFAQVIRLANGEVE
jgi:hypothetical protein